MTDPKETKIPCTKDDLEKAEEIFSHAINEKLSNSNLKLNEISDKFHELLQRCLVIQPSLEEDHESQELKDKIEKSQNKAVRLKTNLEIQRNLIITNVREKIEKMLQEKCPKIEDFDEESILDDEIHDEEFLANLMILDDNIRTLKSQLSETNSRIQYNTKKFKHNAINIENFLKSCY
ncbi:hypothetical protein M9Y10_043276 [Tritrichomonas musculus]|uniref:Uncharacterized protein n=1 Tax=Tritrichomonas musculus TaxID=1915356 RepID=A0ABR2JZ80_9EUKA